MFPQLFAIEWTRLTRRALFWLSLTAVILFTGYSQRYYYTANVARLFNGDLAMPGFSFDLATALDQVMLIAQPLLIVMTAVVLGSDYTQRTTHHWLMRTSRPASLMSKFTLLALITFLIHILAFLVGGGIGWYVKSQTFQTFSLANVNWLATLAAPFYMTLVTLPYLAFTLLITVASRSTIAGIVVGLGYTQFMETMLSRLFAGLDWTRWLMYNLYLSATYLLNGIGNQTVSVPPHLHRSVPALVIAAAYTLILLALGIGLFNRQDVGG